jgi:spore germination cell wall hydrolase CwlJ-like protein
MINEAILCLAVGVYFEARSESLYEQLLVANTISNRVASKHYPNNYCEVISQYKQFSFLNDVTKHNPIAIKEDDVFRDIYAVAEYYYTYQPHYHSGCHYAKTTISNKWTRTFKKVITSGAHTFYEGGCNDIKTVAPKNNTTILVATNYKNAEFRSALTTHFELVKL